MWGGEEVNLSLKENSACLQPRISPHPFVRAPVDSATIYPKMWCPKQQVSRSLQGLGRGFAGWFWLMGSPMLSTRAVVIGHPMAWGRESSSLTGPLRGQHVVRASDLRGGRGGEDSMCLVGPGL